MNTSNNAQAMFQNRTSVFENAAQNQQECMVSERTAEEARAAEILGLHSDDANSSEFGGGGGNIHRQQQQRVIGGVVSSVEGAVSSVGMYASLGHDTEVDYSELNDYDDVGNNNLFGSVWDGRNAKGGNGSIDMYGGGGITQTINSNGNNDAAMHKRLTELTEDDTELQGIPISRKKTLSDSADANMEGEDDAAVNEADKRSVYVGNVDYSATPHELQEHFKCCGAINRITIMVDRYSGHPKGYAYIEFADENSVPNAVVLCDTLLRGRQIKVDPKRKNIPGYNVSGHRGRGKFRGARGRGLSMSMMRGGGGGFSYGRLGMAAVMFGRHQRHRGRGMKFNPY